MNSFSTGSMGNTLHRLWSIFVDWHCCRLSPRVHLDVDFCQPITFRHELTAQSHVALRAKASGTARYSCPTALIAICGYLETLSIPQALKEAYTRGWMSPWRSGHLPELPSGTGAKVKLIEDHSTQHEASSIPLLVVSIWSTFHSTTI